MLGVLEPQRPLGTVRLPGKAHTASICAVRQEAADGDDGSEGGAPAAQETRLAVATAEGILYSYRLELPAESSNGSLRCSLEGEWGIAVR